MSDKSKENANKNARNVPRLLTVLVVLAVLGLIVGSGLFMVDETEEGVILKFGRYDRTVGPGLHFKIPLGIERSYKVPTQVIQNMAFGFRVERAGVNTVFSNVDYPEESTMLTGDLNIIDVEWIIQYRIADPRAWLFNVEARERTIRDISQAVVNQLIGDRAILDVIATERTNIEEGALVSMNEILNSYNLGVRITQVRLQNIVPPEGRVQDAFEDVNKAIQDMNRLINEGRQQYNNEIPRIRGEAQAVINVAEGYQAQRVNRATGDVDRFDAVVTEYLQAPETTRSRLYYEMFEDVFEDAENTELVDRNLENLVPLLQVNRGSGLGIGQPASTAGTAGAVDPGDGGSQ